MIRIVVANRKGGVGKTTTVLNLAAAFALKQKRVLVVDLDTQANSSYFLGEHKEGVMDQMLLKEPRIEKSRFENIDFIGANVNFNISKIEKKTLLKRLLRRVGEYDYCIIDTSPAFDILLLNALKAADFALIPVQTDLMSILALKQFLQIFYKSSLLHNRYLRLLGVVPTMFNQTIKEHHLFVDELTRVVGKEKLFKPIRRDFNATRYLMEMKIPVLAKSSLRLSRDYIDLAQDIEKKIKEDQWQR